MTGARLLLVDDDPCVLDAMAECLARAGYHVTLAADGTQAMLYLSRMPGEWDAIVLDYRMPPPDGIDVIRAIATAPSNFGLKGVVLHTAEPTDSPGFRELLSRTGCTLPIVVIAKSRGCLDSIRSSLAKLIAE